MVGQIEVFDTQADAFTNPKPTSVEQLRHELVGAGHTAEDAQGFLPCKNVWKAFRAFGSYGLEREIEGHVEDRFIEEDECVERLIS